MKEEYNKGECWLHDAATELLNSIRCTRDD